LAREREYSGSPTTAYRRAAPDGTDHQHDEHVDNYTEAEDLAGRPHTTGQAAEATPYLRTRRLP
jgi:hypothetical protein